MISTDVRRWNAVIGTESILASDRAKQILAYWDGLRDGRMAPRRGEVDPIDLFDFLPNLAMIKPVEGGRDFEFSLIGTGLAKVYGLVTRQVLSRAECWAPTRDALEEGLRLCAAARAPVHGVWDRTRTVKGVEVDIEVVLLPISEDGADVSRILCYHAISA